MTESDTYFTYLPLRVIMAPCTISFFHFVVHIKDFVELWAQEQITNKYKEV